ncbi:MAG: hypothetical protein J0H00_07410 [Burkholderiales bacterium]|nr:hypothetical protein [Burkholderiales bacterium]
MGKPNFIDIAESFELWSEYVDPDATMTRAEFDDLPVAAKIKLQAEAFGGAAAVMEAMADAGIEGDQDWDAEITVYTMSDGSVVEVSGPEVAAR